MQDAVSLSLTHPGDGCQEIILTLPHFVIPSADDLSS